MTNEYEPPHKIEDIKIIDGVIKSLQNLQSSGYGLFIVSNQPDYAKGKTGLENLKEVHKELQRILTRDKIFFKEYYYCFHHPMGVVNEYSVDCECRKPKPYFVLKAIEEYKIDSELSWFIGDRDSDISCGISSGLKTILIKNEHSKNYLGKNEALFNLNNLKEASEIILKSELNSGVLKNITASNDKVI